MVNIKKIDPGIAKISDQAALEIQIIWDSRRAIIAKDKGNMFAVNYTFLKIRHKDTFTSIINDIGSHLFGPKF